MTFKPDNWFDDDEYIGSEVSFPTGSVWKLETKIHEHDYFESQQDCEELDIQSEARGVFLCSKVSGDGPPTAVIKIRLQIPWLKTVTKKPDIRARQAISKTPGGFLSEIIGLGNLTRAGCSSSPSFLAWKKDKQAHDEWVPGGYKLSILMEDLPGSDPSDMFITGRTSLEERDCLRKAFKEAWLETVRCGVVHGDGSISNLIYDKEGKKCYLVDWEHWRSPNERTVWEDRIYIRWHLAQAGPSHDLFDTSDWSL